MLRSPASLFAICLLVTSPVHAGSIVQFQWAVEPMIGTGNSSAHGVVTDHSGNTLFCGTFTDTLVLPTGALRATGETGPGNADVFLVKQSPNGTVLWARHGGNSTLGSNEVGYDVAVDPAGNAYVTGEYSGASPTSFGSFQIDDTGGGAFVVKYDPDGTVLWATSVSTTGVGNAVATFGSSLVYVFVGGFPTSSVKKLDPANGNELASWDFTGLMFDQSQELSVDGSGDVISSGTFYATVDFDPGPGTSNLVGDANGDGFIVKHSSTGALLWARQLTSTGSDNVSSHAIGPNDDVYFSGSAGDAVSIGTATALAGGVVGRLNSDGVPQWLRNAVSDFSGSPLDLAADVVSVDEAGSYYITGPGLFGGGTIGAFTIPSALHFHVVKYAPDGSVTYAKFVTAGSPNNPEALLVHSSDFFHVVGWAVADQDFGGITLDDINGSPRSAPFVAQLGVAQQILWPRPSTPG